jgi:hypothetical protein
MYIMLRTLIWDVQAFQAKEFGVTARVGGKSRSEMLLDFLAQAEQAAVGARLRKSGVGFGADHFPRVRVSVSETSPNERLAIQPVVVPFSINHPASHYERN